MNGLLTILMLTFFVVMHEAGHYFAARFSKVAVSEFFVGFGPKIFSFKKNGTEYGLKGIPFGGYVKIPGMDESEPTKDYADLIVPNGGKNKISIDAIVTNIKKHYI